MIETLLVSVFFGETQTKYIEAILSGLALSFSIEEVETAPSECAARDGLSRVRLLVSAISGVGSSLRCYRGYDVCLNNMLHGLKADESTYSDTYEDESKGKDKGRGRGVGSAEGQRSLGRRNSDVHDGIGEREVRDRDRDSDRDRESRNDLLNSTGHAPSTSTHNTTDTAYMGTNDHANKNEKKKEDTDTATPSSSWLTQGDLPLLARPLLDTAVLLLALTHPSVLCEEEETVQETFDEIIAATAVSGYSAAGQVILRGQIICEIEGSSSGLEKDEGKGKQVDTHYHQDVPGASACGIRWLCIAALAQLMVADHMQGDVSVDDTLPSCSTSSSTPSFSSSFSATSTVTHDAVLETWSVCVLYTKLAGVVQCNTSRLHGYTQSLATNTQDTKRVTSVLEKWHAFLSVIARMLFLCRPDLAAELSCYPQVDLTSQVRLCFLSCFLLFTLVLCIVCSYYVFVP